MKSLVRENTYPLVLIVPFILSAIIIAFIAVTLLRSFGTSSFFPHLANNSGPFVGIAVVSPKVDAIEIADITLLPEHIAPLPTVAKLAVARKAVFKANQNAKAQGPPAHAAANDIVSTAKQPSVPKPPLPDASQETPEGGQVAGAATEVPSGSGAPTINPQQQSH